jgi:hypothetical protein
LTKISTVPNLSSVELIREFTCEDTPTSHLIAKASSFFP